MKQAETSVLTSGLLVVLILVNVKTKQVWQWGRIQWHYIHPKCALTPGESHTPLFHNVTKLPHKIISFSVPQEYK
jgi:hypothetical protein